jgi:hypothetical protein
MNDLLKIENAVAAIRVSSIKQGLQGDSPEAQKEQIEQFAKVHNINVRKFFIFMESASREEQPVQEAIDYCKNPKNDIQLFVIKSIDRFTRGGSYLYDHLKMQLTQYGVQLVDIYGIIGTRQVNTLEHLGVEYDWSVYSPTKKAEILEAERAKDEMRDIMSRMIGAEIRYVRMGYRVRRAPFGYMNEKAETPHGRRVILVPDPNEAQWVLKMFDLRIRGTLSDVEIVDELNKLGFKSRKQLIRNPKDRSQVLGQRGGNELTLKQFLRHVSNPIYAGVNIEKWTDNKPVKSMFDGLVSIETFNKANRGKIILTEEVGEMNLYKERPADWRLKKMVKNPDYPFKRYVLCSVCKHPLLGSASRGKMGKHYPAYHCNKKGHHFRIPSGDFEITVHDFVKNLKITPEGVQIFKLKVMEQWDKTQESSRRDVEGLENKIKELTNQKTTIGNSLVYLTSETAIKMMESKLNDIIIQLKKLEKTKAEKADNEFNMEIVSEIVGYYLEHLEELILGSRNPLKRAAYFGLVFEEAPTYQELISGTPQLAPHIELIRALNDPNNQLVDIQSVGWNTLYEYLTRVYHTFEQLNLKPSFNYLPLGT